MGDIQSMPFLSGDLDYWETEYMYGVGFIGQGRAFGMASW